jgi:hypothetical protein
MDTNKKENESPKKNVAVPVTILIVVISLIVIIGLLATSNFDFLDVLTNLHGG